ncbi:hypothetical protein HY638_04430 [Candidatus Woesearchaeota archaeon]|nr:hypothetical protein [Candidatus Woesearchaeota archaeon]
MDPKKALTFVVDDEFDILDTLGQAAEMDWMTSQRPNHSLYFADPKKALEVFRRLNASQRFGLGLKTDDLGTLVDGYFLEGNLKFIDRDIGETKLAIPEEVLQSLGGMTVTSAIVDYRMPGLTGHELLTKIYETDQRVVPAILTGRADRQEVINLWRDQQVEPLVCFRKPITGAEFTRFLTHSRKEYENPKTREGRIHPYDISTLDSEMKNMIDSFSFYLTRLGRSLDDEVLKRKLTGKQDQIVKELITPIYKREAEQLQNFWTQYATMKGALPEDQQLNIDRYAREKLISHFLGSAFIWKAHEKTLGYAGDYRLMIDLYQNVPEADTTIGLLIDKWTKSIPASQAVRHRLEYTASTLDATAQEFNGDVRMLLIAAGPAYGTREWLNRVTRPISGHVTLLDQDPEALDYAQNGINSTAAARSGFRSYIAPTPISKIFGKTFEEILTEVHGLKNLINADGVLDYLDDSISSMLILFACRLLDSKGTFTGGNMANTDKMSTEYQKVVGRWDLPGYRTPEHMLQIGRNVADTLGMPFTIRVDQNPDGRQLYLVMKRTT